MDNAHAFTFIPLYQWNIKVEQLKTSCHLFNSSSIKESMNEYIKKYGDVEKAFATDMFDEDSFLGLVLHKFKNKPNAKQLSLA